MNASQPTTKTTGSQENHSGDPTPRLRAQTITCVRQGRQTLDVPALDLFTNDVLAVVGPNGAGKSTLLLALAAHHPTSTGSVWFEGKRIGDGISIREFHRRTAMVFQEPLLLDRSVFKNVAVGLTFRHLSRPEIEKRVATELDRFGIRDLSLREARTLSGGEAQRVSLARALVVQPDILFLDEPFAALDRPTRQRLMVDLERILPAAGCTVVLATHDREEALRLATRLAVMDNGRIHQLAPVSEVLANPADEFVASFVGVETILSGVVMESSGGRVRASIGAQKHLIDAVSMSASDVAHAIQERIVLGIRPEHVSLSEIPSDETAIRSECNVFSARVVRLIPLGAYVRVELDAGFPLVSFITPGSAERLRLEEGRSVCASFKATAVHVIR